MQSKEETFVLAKCECGIEIMEVDYWRIEGEFCFSQFRYIPVRHSLRTRLKFLFTGKINYNEVILNKKNAKIIADYINQKL